MFVTEVIANSPLLLTVNGLSTSKLFISNVFILFNVVVFVTKFGVIVLLLANIAGPITNVPVNVASVIINIIGITVAFTAENDIVLVDVADHNDTKLVSNKFKFNLLSFCLVICIYVSPLNKVE